MFYAVVAAFATVALALVGVQLLRSTARQSDYLINLDRTFRLGETGLNNAIGALVRVGFQKIRTDPDEYLKFTNWVVYPEEKGRYRNEVYRSPYPTPCYYIKTVVQRRIANRCYHANLHTFVELSNISDYFAAIDNEFTIESGTDLSRAKVYGLNVYFNYQPGKITKVRRAEFVGSVDPPLDWSPETKARFNLTEPGLPNPKPNQPIQLPQPLLMPQVTDADLKFYETVATAQHSIPGARDMKTYQHIYPPGYVGAKAADDQYPAHSADNTHHVYFSTGQVDIGDKNWDTIIHGQVLLVSTSNIYIHGNILSAADTVPLPGAGNTPVAVYAGSSTAHQLVLITPGNVVIEDDYSGLPIVKKTQRIQAMVIAPHGTLQPNRYSIPIIHYNLKLEFTGAMILNSLPAADATSPGWFSEVFRDEFGGPARTYVYMDSLLTRPPPYIPLLANILYSFEEVLSFGQCVSTAPPPYGT